MVESQVTLPSWGGKNHRSISRSPVWQPGNESHTNGSVTGATTLIVVMGLVRIPLGQPSIWPTQRSHFFPEPSQRPTTGNDTICTGKSNNSQAKVPFADLANVRKCLQNRPVVKAIFPVGFGRPVGAIIAFALSRHEGGSKTKTAKSLHLTLDPTAKAKVGPGCGSHTRQWLQ